MLTKTGTTQIRNVKVLKPNLQLMLNSVLIFDKNKATMEPSKEH